MNLDVLEQMVIEWGQKKGILDKSEPSRQLDKTEEELHETREALSNYLDAKSGDDLFDGVDLDALKHKLELELGDIVVTLALVAHMLDTDLGKCLHKAYIKIKNRQGKMVNGQFQKET